MAADEVKARGLIRRALERFFRLEAASALVLLGGAVVAMVWANSPWASLYRQFSGGEFSALVNDGLMTFFFWTVGMEIKRELAGGELDSPGKAALPAVAALGGMLVPASLYAAFNAGGPGAAGWGIPMATDIAFSVGVLTLLKSRVPHALLVFLTALAIFDDIGGILVIALFYGHGLNVIWLLAAMGLGVGLFVLNRAQVRASLVWTVALGLMWGAMHLSGIHATLAGVAVGLAMPLDALERVSRVLVPPVAFGLMPLFALINAGVALGGTALSLSPVALGTGLGLVVGKPLGIVLFTFAAVKLGLAPRPGGASWLKVLGVACVAGIGFTVALFIAGLAFPTDATLLDAAKLAILLGSLASGVLGAGVLRATPREAA